MILNRREFVLSGACGLAVPTVGGATLRAPNRTRLDYEDALLDRLWMYGHDSGEHDGPGGQYGIPLSAPISVADATCDFGIRNVTMCRWGHASDEYLEQFKGLKRVKWAICGSKDRHYRNLLEHNFALVDKLPNLCGFELDDYFRVRPPCEVVTTSRGLEYTAPASFSYGELLRLRERARSVPRKMDLHLVLYNYQTSWAINPTLDAVDSVHFWVWRARDIPFIRQDFAAFRKRAPDLPAFLGIYMWDFGDKKPLPVEGMKAQLDAGLDLYRAGEIEGLVFHCSPLVNKNLEAVDFARRWIGEHAHEIRGERKSARPVASSASADAPVADILSDRLGTGAFQGAVSVLSDAEDRLTVTTCGIREGTPVTLDAPFALGALGATVAGAAIAKGVELGFLNPTDAVSDFLPEYESLPMKLSVAEALLQTAGFVKEPGRDAVSLRERVRAAADARFFASEGERQFRASAVSVDVACACLEVASGTDFASFVRRHLFEPLELSATSFGRLPSVFDLVSTPRDFVRFLQFHAHHGSWRGRTLVARKIYDDLIAEPLTEKSGGRRASLGGAIVRGKWMTGDMLGLDADGCRAFAVNTRFAHSRLLVTWGTAAQASEPTLVAKWKKAADALQRGRDAIDALE